MPDVTGPLVGVAVSGGRDSLSLLHATVAAAHEEGLSVVAMHVHHGLSPRADDWLSHVERTCERWHAKGLPVIFTAARLDAGPPAGASVEAWARRERYAALTRLAMQHGVRLVLLGHHRSDQAETVMLQALRGAGPAGLAAMRSRWVETTPGGNVTFARPWLRMSTAAIASYAGLHRLKWVDDESNDDHRFARNRLRHAVMPALRAAFPDAEERLAEVAAQAGQARRLMDEVGASDVAGLGGATAPSLRASAGPVDLQRESWLALPPARRLNALRYWIGQQLRGREGHEALLARLVEEWPAARSGTRWPVDGDIEVRHYRGVLGVATVARATGPGQPVGEGLDLPPVDLTRPQRIPLPAWGGVLEVSVTQEGGVPVGLLWGARLAPRASSHRFQRHPAGLPRSLKKQFQEAGVAAWDRTGPVVTAGRLVLWVAGLGVDARAQAGRGQAQRQLRWLPDDTGHEDELDPGDRG